MQQHAGGSSGVWVCVVVRLSDIMGFQPLVRKSSTTAAGFFAGGQQQR
jgi:hypothetical protein